jgi:hypothetical protein
MDPFILDNLSKIKDKGKVFMFLIHKIFIMVIGKKMLCMDLVPMFLNLVNAIVDN